MTPLIFLRLHRKHKVLMNSCICTSMGVTLPTSRADIHIASVTVSTQAFMKYLDSFNETDALVRSLRVFVKYP